MYGKTVSGVRVLVWVSNGINGGEGVKAVK